jgi:hypothetical protein
MIEVQLYAHAMPAIVLAATIIAFSRQIQP